MRRRQPARRAVGRTAARGRRARRGRAARQGHRQREGTAAVRDREPCRCTLPAHKRILSYDISMEPLPRTTTGKIRRHEIQRRLRDRAASADAETRPIGGCRCAVGRRAGSCGARSTAIAQRIGPRRRQARRESRTGPGPRFDGARRIADRCSNSAPARACRPTRARRFSRCGSSLMRCAWRRLRKWEQAAGAARAATEAGGELPWDTLLATAADQVGD